MKDVLINIVIFLLIWAVLSRCSGHGTPDSCKYRCVAIGIQSDGAEAYHFNSYGKLPDGGIYFNSIHDDDIQIEVHGSYTLEQWHK